MVNRLRDLGIVFRQNVNHVTFTGKVFPIREQPRLIAFLCIISPGGHLRWPRMTDLYLMKEAAE